MPMVTLHKVGEGNLYHMHVLDQHGTDPGYGQGRPGGDHISNRPPGQIGGHPDQGLPGHGHPGQGLPGMGGIPGHELPDTPPPNLAPGWTLVLVRGPQGKWQYAAMAPGSPPPRPLPPQGGGRPDQGLPGSQPHPDQGLPTPPPPHVGGGPMPGNPNVPSQGLPPTAQPR